MTRMLASVTSVTEALLALELGADLIDLKDPHSGALGALTLSRLREIVAAIDGRRTLSATIGETPDDPADLRQRILATAQTGVDIVKIGIATNRTGVAAWHGMPWAPVSTRLVAVLFADQPLDLAWIEVFAKQGFHGVMLDTADKHAGSLRAHRNDDQLLNFVRRARENNLLCGLAGALRIADISPLLAIAPDYLGFRGALCRNNSRIDQLDAAAFCAVRARIPSAPQNAALAPAIEPAA